MNGYFEQIGINTLAESARKNIKASAFFIAFNISEAKRKIELSTQTDPLKKGIVEFNNTRLGEPLYEISLIPNSNLESIDFVSPLRDGQGSIAEDGGVVDILIADIQVSKSNELKTISLIDRSGYSSYVNSVGGSIVNMNIKVVGGYRKEDKNWLLVNTLLKHQSDYIIFEFESEFLKTILPQNKLLLTSITYSDSSESSNIIELQCSFVDVNENLKLF